MMYILQRVTKCARFHCSASCTLVTLPCMQTARHLFYHAAAARQETGPRVWRARARNFPNKRSDVIRVPQYLGRS